MRDTDRPTDSDAVARRIDRRLFARHEAGDLYAREQFVERFLPLARAIARRYRHGLGPRVFAFTPNAVQAHLCS